MFKNLLFNRKRENIVLTRDLFGSIYALISLIIYIFSLPCMASQNDLDGFLKFEQRLHKKYTKEQWNWQEADTFFQKNHLAPPQNFSFPTNKIEIEGAQLDSEFLEEQEKFIFKLPNDLLLDLSKVYHSFEEEKNVNIKVPWKDKTLSFSQREIQRVPLIGQYDTRRELEEVIKKAYWKKIIIWQSHIAPSKDAHLSGLLEIKIRHEQKHPLGVKAIAISCNKVQRKTAVFLDIFDQDDLSSEDLLPISVNGDNFFKHKEQESKKSKGRYLKVSHGKMQDVSLTTRWYSIFPNQKAQEKWVSNQNKFLKIQESNNSSHVEDKSSFLPAEYTCIDFEGEEIEGIQSDKLILDPRKKGCFSLVPHTKEMIPSDHIYINKNGAVFAARHCKERWKNLKSCLEEVIEYIEKTEYLLIFKDVVYEGDQESWCEGFYKIHASSSAGREVWELVTQSLPFKKAVEFSESREGSLRALYVDTNQQEDQKRTLEKLNPLKDKSLLKNNPSIKMQERVGQHEDSESSDDEPTPTSTFTTFVKVVGVILILSYIGARRILR